MLKDLKAQDELNNWLQIGISVFGVFTFISLFFIKAHYGRFYDEKKTLFALTSKVGWFLEELPNLAISFYYIFYSLTVNSLSGELLIKIILISFFIVHYIHRGIIYPMNLIKTRKLPSEIIFMGAMFCVVNALMQNRSIFIFAHYNLSSFYNSPLHLAGVFLFLLGMYINIKSDYMVIKEKKDDSYFIPRGFFFEYLSCPNYFGELVEWTGFALMTQTASAWLFVLFSFANLFPRALAYHKWYKEKFGAEYPNNRKAIFPFII
jgi:3-oxo-5-alpha-steroid 4-dehydrogenase 1